MRRSRFRKKHPRSNGSLLALHSGMICLLLAAGSAAAAIHVDGDNSSGIEDGSHEHPYRLISSGMAAASGGDTVLVMPGTYSEWIGVDMHGGVSDMNSAAVVMKNGVTLQSVRGPDSTLIFAMNTQAAVYFDSCSGGTRLAGFTTQMEGMGFGSRMSIWCWASSPVIEGNVIDAAYPGIYCDQPSSPVIRGNSVLWGGAVALYNGAGGTVADNVIEGGVFVSCWECQPRPLAIHGNTIFGPTGSRESHGIEIGPAAAAEAMVDDNTISGHTIGAEVCYGVLRGNRFEGNAVNLKARKYYCDSPGDIMAELNWWGTADPSEIAAKIVDCTDDPGIISCVDYDPWCMDEQCVQSAALGVSWGTVKAMYRLR